MCMFVSGIGIYGECERVRIDIREIWICGDIDQVECSQGEHLVWEGSGFSGKQKITAASFASSTQQAASFMSLALAISPLDNCKQREFFYLSLMLQAEILSLGDDYPNKRSFKLLLVVVCVAVLCWYVDSGVQELKSLSVWTEKSVCKMTLNFVAVILILILRLGSDAGELPHCYNMIATEVTVCLKAKESKLIFSLSPLHRC